MRNIIILFSDKLPHFHGQFATREIGDRVANPGYNMFSNIPEVYVGSYINNIICGK
jgi:hypothetical protein